MPKISLPPPKVKCWLCGGRGWVYRYYKEPGTLKKPCDCDDGYCYDFGDLEKVLLEHDFLYKVFGYPKGCEAYIIPCVAVSDRVEFIRLMACVSAKGRDGTTALLNAITKFNEE